MIGMHVSEPIGMVKKKKKNSKQLWVVVHRGLLALDPNQTIEKRFPVDVLRLERQGQIEATP